MIIEVGFFGSFADVLRERRSSPPAGTTRRAAPALRKIGVNERCPCGSGKKFKKCCMNRGASA